MILYSLACDEGHRFQTWFRDGAAYDDQATRQLVSCPTCRSTRVTKTIMAPSVVTARKGDAAQIGEDTRKSTTDLALLDPRRQEIAALLKSIRETVISNGQDVGERFPEEARRIHDGDAQMRQIYGRASVAEALELLEDGIPVLPLPVVPDDLN